MACVVFDTSAVIALLRNEAGVDMIAHYAGDAQISAVNLQEVVKALLVRGFSINVARTMIDALNLEMRPPNSVRQPKSMAAGLVTERAWRWQLPMVFPRS
jgi:PIN domain nuclease of toxin-antitoxin system